MGAFSFGLLVCNTNVTLLRNSYKSCNVTPSPSLEGSVTTPVTRNDREYIFKRKKEATK
jgi:hypothetical protein